MERLRRAFDRWFYAAFLAYVLSSVLIVVMWIETEVDAPFWYGLRRLTIPWIAVLYAGWRLLDPDFLAHVRNWVAHLVLALWAVFLAVGSGGYVALANHLLGPHEIVRQEGKVERLGRVRGRIGPTDYFVVLRRVDGTTVNLTAPRGVHEGLRVGQHFRQTMVRGGLGLNYRLR